MKNPHAIYYTAIGLLLLLAAVFFVVDQRSQNEFLSTKVSGLEKQLLTLSNSLIQVASTSRAYKKEIDILANKPAPTQRLSQDDILTATVAKATPAVVSVIVSKDIPQVEIQYVNPFADRDIGIRIPVYKQVGTKKTNVGGGTGFIIRSDGYIVTNKHVVADTNAEYVVLLSTGVQKTAQVFYRDSAKDLAILKITGTSYPTIPLGNSQNIKLGQTVAAIGNALGEYNNSVSVGIISGLNRTIQAADANGNVETLSGVIQTDTAINKGNSGGPLLDLEGKVIGVNVAVQQGANSISFAIPVNSLRTLLDQVL
ncbi:MAG: trypsin-like peptidase domain-containing protein [Candidatus Taylorbacteria bacterium]|nr:trypsin-like peptidase domain-containing protein [Candidatus Taylorbacteria bacterium]